MNTPAITHKIAPRAIMDETKPIRDGVWTCNGLSADFVHLYEHPNAGGIHRVLTVSGEHYAPDYELEWDTV